MNLNKQILQIIEHHYLGRQGRQGIQGSQDIEDRGFHGHLNNIQIKFSLHAFLTKFRILVSTSFAVISWQFGSKAAAPAGEGRIRVPLDTEDTLPAEERTTLAHDAVVAAVSSVIRARAKFTVQVQNKHYGS